MTKQLLETKKS